MRNALFAFLIVAVAGLYAQAAPVGATFLSLDNSPRSAALGRAGSATVSATDAMNMNPAGLSAGSSSQLSATHTQLFEDSALSSFAISRPFGLAQTRQAFGFNATYLNYGTVSMHDENRAEVGQIRPSDLSVGLSYARILGRTTAGLTVKGLHQKLGDQSATGVAADAGVQMAILTPALNAGFSIMNVGPSMKFVSERFSLPTTARFGLGYAIGNFNILGDVGTPVRGGKTWFALGTEFTPVSVLSLRAGYLMSGESKIKNSASTADNLARFAGLSGGIGLQVGRYQLNYSLTPHAQLGNTQTLGFLLNFR